MFRYDTCKYRHVVRSIVRRCADQIDSASQRDSEGYVSSRISEASAVPYGDGQRNRAAEGGTIVGNLITGAAIC